VEERKKKSELTQKAIKENYQENSVILPAIQSATMSKERHIKKKE